MSREVECGCGCGERFPAGGGRRYVNERHRQRAYRRRVKAAAEARGLPGSLSLQSVEATGRAGRRNGDAEKGGERPIRRPRPGVTVYFPTPGAAELALAAVRTQGGAWRREAEGALERALERRRARGR